MNHSPVFWVLPAPQRWAKAKRNAVGQVGHRRFLQGSNRRRPLQPSSSSRKPRAPFDTQPTLLLAPTAHRDRALHRVPARRLPAVRGARRGQPHPLQEGVPGLHEHRAGCLYKGEQGHKRLLQPVLQPLGWQLKPLSTMVGNGMSSLPPGARAA